MPVFDVSYYNSDGAVVRNHTVEAENYPSAARKSHWPDHAVRKEVTLLKSET